MRIVPSLLAAAAALVFANPLSAQDPVILPTEVSLEIFPEKVRVRWTLPPAAVDHALTTRHWQLQNSATLGLWSPAAPEVIVAPGDGRTSTWADVPVTGSRHFFRLTVTDKPAFLAGEGGDVTGYTSALDAALVRNAGITPQDIPALFPPVGTRTGISFDPAEAEFWTEWNTDPAVWNAGLPANSPDRRLTDFRLDPAGVELLKRNGFVVSEPGGAPSFTDLYYRIWTDDLPVYVTSDSILHAWHRTWITMLEELEEIALRDRLITVLTELKARLQTTVVPPGLYSGLLDATEFVRVAHRLATYTGIVALPPPSWEASAFTASGSSTESMFGSPRVVDWTQFGPRAHYTNSDTLKSYFRAMMWLNQVDLRIDTLSNDVPRELAAAVVLTICLKDAELMDDWEEIDGVLTAFSGHADSLTPPRLFEILQSENLSTLDRFSGPAALKTLLEKIKSGDAGVQLITGHPIAAPAGERLLVLPRSFTFFGQRFTPESWAFSRMVFDHIWRENETGSGPPMVRVLRRLPSALEVNFAVMGNDAPADILSRRMIDPGVNYRDGLDFSRELVSLRQIFDSQPASSWGGTLYLHALGAIRSLSAPLPASAPEAMQTEAWGLRTAHSQLAAWTELRHDNLLYAKQSYTPPVLCDYPAGYVEPRPAFFEAMKRLTDFAHTAVTALPMTGTWSGRPYTFPGSPPTPRTIDRAFRKTNWLTQFASMSTTFATLRTLAQAELDHVPFDTTQTNFIKSLVQEVGTYGSGDGRTYSGWYPGLYLQSAFTGGNDPHPSEMWDPLVADIHTDSPDGILTDDPGAVLYNATGNAALLLVAIDVHGRRCLHGGPAFTYYEFTRPYGQTRLNDQTWKDQVRQKQQPAHPEWTSGFLVPGPITVPAGL